MPELPPDVKRRLDGAGARRAHNVAKAAVDLSDFGGLQDRPTPYICFAPIGDSGNRHGERRRIAEEQPLNLHGHCM